MLQSKMEDSLNSGYSDSNDSKQKILLLENKLQIAESVIEELNQKLKELSTVNIKIKEETERSSEDKEMAFDWL